MNEIESEVNGNIVSPREFETILEAINRHNNEEALSVWRQAIISAMKKGRTSTGSMSEPSETVIDTLLKELTNIGWFCCYRKTDWRHGEIIWASKMTWWDRFCDCYFSEGIKWYCPKKG